MEHVTSREVAMIIAETIPVAGGMIMPPPEWLPRLAELAKRWGAVFVLDEAQLAPAKRARSGLRAFRRRSRRAHLW